MGGGVENLELLQLSPGKPRHWQRKWGGEGRGSSVDAKPSRAWDRWRLLSTPELAHSLPAPGSGGTEAMSGEEARRAEQEVSAGLARQDSRGAAGFAAFCRPRAALPEGAGGARGAGKGAGCAVRPVAAGSRHSQRESLAACLIAVWLPQPGGSSSLG